MDAQVAVPDRELERACVQRLTGAGAEDDIAVAVTRALTRNERRGYPSHGLLRLRDYLTAIERGTLDPRARPADHDQSAAGLTVDSRGGLCVLSSAVVAALFVLVLEAEQLAAVALVNSTLVGRPADIGEQVTRAGGIVLGWINNPGAQERVLAWRGPPRLRTNPVLVAIPRAPRPFVLDISTSTVAEGKLRERMLAGQDVPEGWLVDEHWRPVTEPRRAFDDPPTAFLPPLGGEAGHKGFGLSLAVELLAGTIAGAGHDGPVGNGGLFLGLDPTAFGRGLDDIEADLAELRAHIDGDDVRWPGEAPEDDRDDSVAVPRWLWEYLDAK